jgi:putative sugar O-methyltransferase
MLLLQVQARKALSLSSARIQVAERGLGDEDREYLSEGNRRLIELREAYTLSSYPAHSQWSWTRTRESLNLRSFRGDGLYLFQSHDLNDEINYVVSAYYLQSIDKLGLLQRSTEDGAFGAEVFDFNGSFLVSRDLIDSLTEIYFLERALKVSGWKSFSVLDIGAGYGRLGHRLVCSMPNLGKVLCADAVPESTFLSEYYLRFRRVDEKAKAIPLYELESVLDREHVDIATNVHSFSECPASWISWWLTRLRRYKVRYLMIVPNGSFHGGMRLLSSESDLRQLDYSELLEAQGYRLMTREPKYLQSVAQRHGVSPTHHWLFELSG